MRLNHTLAFEERMREKNCQFNHLKMTVREAMQALTVSGGEEEGARVRGEEEAGQLLVEQLHDRSAGWCTAA